MNILLSYQGVWPSSPSSSSPSSPPPTSPPTSSSPTSTPPTSSTPTYLEWWYGRPPPFASLGMWSHSESGAGGCFLFYTSIFIYLLYTLYLYFYIFTLYFSYFYFFGQCFEFEIPYKKATILFLKQYKDNHWTLWFWKTYKKNVTARKWGFFIFIWGAIGSWIKSRSCWIEVNNNLIRIRIRR